MLISKTMRMFALAGLLVPMASQSMDKELSHSLIGGGSSLLGSGLASALNPKPATTLQKFSSWVKGKAAAVKASFAGVDSIEASEVSPRAESRVAGGVIFGALFGLLNYQSKGSTWRTALLAASVASMFGAVLSDAMWQDKQAREQYLRNQEIERNQMAARNQYVDELRARGAAYQGAARS